MLACAPMVVSARSVLPKSAEKTRDKVTTSAGVVGFSIRDIGRTAVCLPLVAFAASLLSFDSHRYVLILR